MTAFILREAIGTRPPHDVATFESVKVACVLAFRRCHDHAAEPEENVAWTEVDALMDDGQRVTLVELFRTPKDQVGMRPPDYAAFQKVLPEFFPYDHLAVWMSDAGERVVLGTL